ncbi:MAG: porphobilinogen synthase [Candidatus Omnitrophica bacterium]|nr:porphobilinogen synthase [Candidatus Omnitrophota bacterium]
MQARFPNYRPRRLRQFPVLRRLIQETRLMPEQLIAPVFVASGLRRREPILSMPGVFRLPPAEAVEEAAALSKRKIGGILLFGIPDRKDEAGSGAFDPDGVVQQAVRAIKRAVPDFTVITDVCLCEYTAHGHCGIVPSFPRKRESILRSSRRMTVSIDNDATLPVLAKIAVSHAKAGADLVAPSAMMDGQVGAIRRSLDAAGFTEVPIMSYAAKYASALYGPFREAVESAPKFGDRRSYQMDPANREEALREVALDIKEGADLVMVKPAIAYLDVLKAVKETFHWPTAAYQVSGEYALIKAAASKGWVDEKQLVLEFAAGIKRAGADLIITYYAKQLAEWLNGGKNSRE